MQETTNYDRDSKKCINYDESKEKKRREKSGEKRDLNLQKSVEKFINYKREKYGKINKAIKKEKQVYGQQKRGDDVANKRTNITSQ